MPERVWDPLFFGFDKVRELSPAVSREDGIASELSLAKVTDQNASLDLNAGSVTAILRQGYDPRFWDRHFYALHYTHTVGKGKTQGQFSFEGRQIRHVTHSAEGRGQESVLVKVNLYKSVYMVDNATLAEWVSKFILDGKKSDLLGVLQIFDPRIVDLTTLVENNGVNARPHFMWQITLLMWYDRHGDRVSFCRSFLQPIFYGIRSLLYIPVSYTHLTLPTICSV